MTALFKNISKVSGANAKLELLKNNNTEFILDVLRYAYDPFKHYYINKIKVVTSGNTRLEETKWKSLLYQLHKRILSGNKAKNVVHEFIDGLDKDSQEVFINILKKDLRCGIGISTINKAFPGLIDVFGVMRAKEWSDSLFITDTWYMSLKMDGVRAMSKEGVLYSRNGHKWLGIDHINEIIPDNVYMDGELMIPDKHFQESSGKLRGFELSPDAVFHVFDIHHADDFRPFNLRYSDMADYFEDFELPPFIKLVKHIKAKSLEHIHTTFQKALAAGYEGLVLKTKDHKYQMKRSNDWRKLKASKSEDLEVVGFFEGTGKYTDALGGLIVDRNGVEVRVGSGFSDAERYNIWNDKSSFIGQTVEVKYHEVTPGGSLRHPVYKTFRYDKNSRD